MEKSPQELVPTNTEKEPFKVRLEEIRFLEKRMPEIQRCITNRRMISALIPQGHPWDLSDERKLGGGTFLNTVLSLSQFCMALAISRHPLIETLNDSNESLDFEKYFFDLEKGKVLSGLRLVDIGSGARPVFTRMCRALGAIAYTVDKIPSDRLMISKDKEGTVQQLIERNHHIQLDIFDEDAIEVIAKKTGGNFNMVTLCPFEGLNLSQEKAKSILDEGGILYTVQGYDRLSAKIDGKMITDINHWIHSNI